MNAIVITLVVKASLLMAAAAVANALMRGRTSAASRHLVWMLALVGVLSLPVFSAIVPAWGIAVDASVLTPSPLPQTSRAIRETAVVQDANVKTTTAATLADPSASAAIDVEAAALPATPVRRDIPWTTIALAVYAAGVALLTLRLLAGRWSVHRLVRRSAEVTDPEWLALLRECEADMGVAHPVRLLRSLDRNMPMAFGIATPTVLIPAIADTWADDRRRAVLLHELAHIARRDCLTQLLASIACAGYWMHPGVWWMSRRLRIERELACDDRVLRAGAVARDYAAHLLELAYSLGGAKSPALVVSMARPRQLEGRMLAILDAARNRVAPSLRAYAVGAAVMAMVVVPLASAEVIVRQDPPVPPVPAQPATPVAPAAPPAPVMEVEISTPPEPLAPLAPLAPMAVRAAHSTQVPPPPPPPPAPPARTREERNREIQLPGTWEVRRSDDDQGRVYLRISDRANSQHGFMIAPSDLDGLSSSLLTGGEGSAKFQIRRDAGTLAFDGVFRGGIGAGTFDFVPNTAFPAEMKRRGFDAPDSIDQYRLARGNIGFAYLDELNNQKYERPTLDGLVRAADHGVHLDYLREMASAGYRFGQLEALVRTRDHGVTPRYIRALSDSGYKNLTADELVRARDHGVTPEYVGAMYAFGYRNLPLDRLINARDHGISEDYIRGMAEAGYPNLPLEQLVRARDHGVGSDFVKAMRDAGYATLSVDELVNARDHGVSADYVRGMLSIGPERPSVSELIAARDRGVSVEFAKAWRDTGYPPVLSDLIRARDTGVNAEYVRDLKAMGYDRLSVEDIIRLRNHGVSTSFVREQNAGSTTRLTVDQLVRRRNGRY
jgi:beta-lactamase regulating signal transducer with metallopeptidase domain